VAETTIEFEAIIQTSYWICILFTFLLIVVNYVTSVGLASSNIWASINKVEK